MKTMATLPTDTSMLTDEAPIHILYIEDDRGLAKVIRKRLQRFGYQVTCATNGAEGLALFDNHTFDLIIVDYAMPHVNGLDFLQAMTERTHVPPIIMLSGRGTIPVAVEAIKLGALDYVVKDLKGEYLDTLPAKIEDVLKRVSLFGGPENRKNFAHKVTFAGWQLNLATGKLTSAKGEDVPLTRGEFKLLVAFLTHPNRVLTRDELLHYSQDREASPFDRSIDVQVGRLRRKIEPDPKQPTLIETVRSAGYLFTVEAQPVEAQ